MKVLNHSTEISNILVIGSGGAGLRAAIQCKMEGRAVTVLGKRSKNDVHTQLAAGGINAAFGNVDSKDSWEQHFADSYIEGYGLGDPKCLEILTKESLDLVTEIDKWGANFNKLSNGKLDQRFFGAHTYRRTCYSGDYTGRSILNALLKKAKELKIPIYDSQQVTELLISNNICFGAFSINNKTGERTVHIADSTILAVGGHTRLWEKSSSRSNENTGDGIYLALKAGCKLSNMEMVQFHPTGMLAPEEVAGTLVTEAVRGEGGRLLNRDKERFMKKYDSKRMELSTRDRVAMAIYLEISEGRGTESGGVYLDISHKKKEFIVKKIPKIYRQFIDLQMLDISKHPMEVAPTAHYSMGGVIVTPEEHWTGIKGLYAAGEVSGGLHGANRLGGNSLSEILVFGKRAGRAATHHSKEMTCQYRSNSAINSAHRNIDSLIKRGSEISPLLMYNLRKIMWKNCGVVRSEEGINEGLNSINLINEQYKELDVRIDSEGFSDLILAIELKASIVSAEATLKSALARKESRGSHQRIDFKHTEQKKPYDTITFMKDEQELMVATRNIETLRYDLKKIIDTTNNIENFEGKLIE